MLPNRYGTSTLEFMSGKKKIKICNTKILNACRKLCLDKSKRNISPQKRTYQKCNLLLHYVSMLLLLPLKKKKKIE